MKIAFFASSDRLPHFLNPFLQKEGYELVDFNANSAPLYKCVILFDPVHHFGHFISCASTWKCYFQASQPEIKFISAGFTKNEHCNYLDLLRLPESFSSFLLGTKTAKEEWTPVYTGGLRMESELHRFLEGHGHDSIRTVFTPIISTIRIVMNEILKYDTDYDEVMTQLILPAQLPLVWKNLYNRWAYYYPKWQCLPFYARFESIHNAIKTIAPYFQSNCAQKKLLLDLDCLENLKKIDNELSTIEKYVC